LCVEHTCEIQVITSTKDKFLARTEDNGLCMVDGGDLFFNRRRLMGQDSFQEVKK